MEDEDPENEDNEDHEEALASNQRSQSPGGMSQMSGTTAITSHSVAELQELDILLVEILPDLLFSSHQILDQLAPIGISPEQVDGIVNELKTPGSSRARQLKRLEEKFKVDRVYYGTETYIQIPLILRKVFGSLEIRGARK